MGLFRKNDELFEIMGRRAEQEGSPSETPSRANTGRFAKPTISWRHGRPETEFYELEGETLIVVEDGWDAGLPLDADEGETRVFPVRTDTMVVGGLLCCGLVGAAFLLGRTSSGPSAPSEQAVVEEEAARQPSAEGEPEVEVQAPARGVTSLPASFRPQRTAAPKPAGRQAAKGKYELRVCTTTPANGKKVAEWFNAHPRSPIAKEQTLQAICTESGSVRIRGFEETNRGVLARVKVTTDPLGGSTRFSSAYFTRRR